MVSIFLKLAFPYQYRTQKKIQGSADFFKFVEDVAN